MARRPVAADDAVDPRVEPSLHESQGIIDAIARNDRNLRRGREFAFEGLLERSVEQLQTLLFGVRRLDVLAFTGMSAVTLVVALLASYVPTLRASRVDPVVALRAGCPG